jgi:stage II sporulation protein D
MAQRSRAPAGARARLLTPIATLTIAACAGGPTPSLPGPPPNAADAMVVRVSLGTMASASLGATGAWRLIDRDGRVVASGVRAEQVGIASSGAGVRFVDRNGSTSDVAAPLSFVTTESGAVVSLNRRLYRGGLAVVAVDSAVRVINRIALEAYLRGVVPRELGVRGDGDRAALEAQAVAARSYAITRLGNASRAYDVTATTSDQVYGGIDAENAVADAAIAATSGLVLSYNGRTVSAPYHSTCGGSTAAPEELWRSESEPFLQRVSDRIPGTDRFYCDIAPRFRWERSWSGDSLTAIVERYIRSYAQVPAGAMGDVRSIDVEARTESGRVAAIWVETSRGRYRVRSNDIRYVLRSAGGELLNSTYFWPEILTRADGRVARLTIRGLGYGHGVGMCQWGAIGRARAGQDFRTILRTYFPGTTVARAY